MAYQTYITEALVCGSYDSKSSDRTYLLFTREAGMLYAHAKSVREERSKHRYALQICSHIRVTLVRGKSGWKITGTESIGNVYAHMETREERAFLRNSILLLKRVIQGETAHTEIFDDVLYALYETPQCDPGVRECILALRTLHTLGYVAPHPTFEIIMHAKPDSAFTQGFSGDMHAEARKVIEHALAQSQL